MPLSLAILVNKAKLNNALINNAIINNAIINNIIINNAIINNRLINNNKAIINNPLRSLAILLAILKPIILSFLNTS